MTTVRRLYFYSLVFISAEVFIWGVVGLLRIIASRNFFNGMSLLATSLLLVLIGLPIFYSHWRIVQRDAATDPFERASRTRAFFLYAILSGLIAAILYSMVSLLARGLLGLLGVSVANVWFGSDRTLIDHGIAILVNATALIYFWRVLRRDWRNNSSDAFLPEVRRLYRYIWMLLGLVLVISGLYNLIRYLLALPNQDFPRNMSFLGGGIALLVIGIPLWGGYWWAIQESLQEPGEKHSLLRLAVLYLVSSSGAIGVVLTLGVVLNSLIRLLAGQSTSFWAFIQGNSAEISVLLPLTVMWAYYGRILPREVSGLSDLSQRYTLRSLYLYILSLLGLSVTCAGLLSLLDFSVRLVFTSGKAPFFYLDLFSVSISVLLVGVPLWLVPWLEVQGEAAQMNRAGNWVRSSLLRKSYLYLVLFMLVVGVMLFSGQLLAALLESTLTQQLLPDLWRTLVRRLLWIAAACGLLVYHWRVLRSDHQVAQLSMGDLHAAFPTLILSETKSSLNDLLIQEIQRIAPRMPVAVHPIELGAPDDAMLGAKAIIIPFSLAIESPESLRLWFNEYHGLRLIIPSEKDGYTWLGQSGRKHHGLARDAARAVRQMSEGETPRQYLPNSPWFVAGYILGGLFGLLLVGLLFGLMISVLFR